jgi:hypothetical protein
MPRPRHNRIPERTDGITVELTEFGLWIEVHDQPSGWEGVFLSARALRVLVTLPPEQRLAALDPAMPTTRRPTRRQASTGTGQPGAA